MLIDLTGLFCDIDDFCKTLEQIEPSNLLPAPDSHHVDLRHSSLSASEMMTIIVAFHVSNYRTFKHFYQHIQTYWREAFPGLVSYPRFIALQPYILIPLCEFLNSRKGRVTGIAFIDSTKLIVCHNKRIYSHRVFNRLAKRGKTSVGWFYGFKLHLIVNECGEILAVKLTTANVDDRVPVPEMTQELFGKLFGDKGYISQKLFDLLFARGLQLVTRIRKNMKNKLMPLMDKILLRKRSIIETINDQLKNISQIEHTRHRSAAGFMLNVLGGLIAYTYQEKKPSLDINPTEVDALPIVI